MANVVTTVVGSYPQPDWLIDRERLGERLPPRVRARELWRVPEPFLEQAQDDATRLAVADMERAGVDVVTDGEMRRESYSNRFATALDGVDLDRPGVALDRTGHENPVPRVVGPIRRTRPVEVRDVEFLRSITEQRIKITVPGPFTMTQQAQNDHYADDREPCARVRGGGQRGAARPEGGRRRRRADRRAVPAGAAGGGARVRGRGDRPRARRHRRRHRAAHVLRLRARSSTTGRAATRSSRELNDCAATHISLEAAQPDLDPAVLRDAAGQDDRARRARPRFARRPRRRTQVAERIRRALEVVPPERLVVAPDCGMKYLPRELAFRKLEAMVAGARRA